MNTDYRLNLVRKNLTLSACVNFSHNNAFSLIFSRNGAHRALHSFPTRRSSDLPDRTDAKDNVIYAARHAIRDGANTITVIVNRPPGVAAIDPYVLRIDRDRFDNFKEVTR